jgi:hypothetical protein
MIIVRLGVYDIIYMSSVQYFSFEKPADLQICIQNTQLYSIQKERTLFLDSQSAQYPD